MENIEILNKKVENISSNIKYLEERMANLNKTSEEYANDLKTLNDLQKMQNDLLNTQKDEIKEVNEETTEEIKTVGDWANRFKELKNELKEGEQALKAMSEAGMNGTEEFRNLAARVGEIKDAMKDASDVTKQYADDAMAIKDVIGVVQVGAAAYGAYSSALSMVGVKSESTEKILRRFAQVQQLMNSLATLQTSLLDKSSVAYRLYNTVLDKLNISKKAEVAATQTSTAATTAQATATTGLATAEGVATGTTGALSTALHALKVALISTGIGAIVVIVGTLIANFVDLEKITKSVADGFIWLKDKVTDAFNAVTDFLGITSEEERAAEKVAAAEKKRKEELEKLKNEIKKTATESLKSSSEQIGKLNELQKVINDTTKSEKDRIDAMKKANEESGKEIYNLKDTQQYMSGMDASIKAYINNLTEEAKAKALLTKIGELYIKQLELEQFQREHGVGPWSKAQLANISEEIKLYESELAEIQSHIVTYNDYKKTVDKVTDSTKEYNEQMEAAKRKKEQDMATINKWADAYNKAIAKTSKKSTENKRFDDQMAALKKSRELEIQYANGNEEEIAKINKKYRDQELVLLAIHNQKMSEIETQEAEENAKKAVIAREAVLDQHDNERAQKSQETELAYDKETNAILKQRQIELMNATGEERTKLELQYIEQDRGRTEKLWDNRLNIARERQEEIDKAIEDLKKNGPEGVEDTEEFQKLLDEKAAQDAQIAEMEQKKEDDITRIDMAAADKRKQVAQQHMDKIKKIYSAGRDAVTGLLGAIADANDEKIERLKEGTEEEKEEAKRLFEQNKKLRIVSATIDMLQGASTAIATAMQLGPIAGPIIGGINAATVITTGMMNISKIKNQEFDSGSSSVSAGGASGGSAGVQFVPEASPLLDENYDMQRLVTTTSTDAQNDVRVYVTEQDITNTQSKVEVREQNSRY